MVNGRALTITLTKEQVFAYFYYIYLKPLAGFFCPLL
jgi:hypothetical protein